MYARKRIASSLFSRLVSEPELAGVLTQDIRGDLFSFY